MNWDKQNVYESRTTERLRGRMTGLMVVKKEGKMEG